MPPRKKRHAKTNKSKKKPLLWILAIILLLIIGGATYYFTSIVNELGSMSNTENSPFKDAETVDVDTPEPPKWEGTEPVNILLMGVDARGVKKGEIPRSDTMLVASLDPVKKKSAYSQFLETLTFRFQITAKNVLIQLSFMDLTRRCRL